jgi:hypothetical protein
MSNGGGRRWPWRLTRDLRVFSEREQGKEEERGKGGWRELVASRCSSRETPRWPGQVGGGARRPGILHAGALPLGERRKGADLHKGPWLWRVLWDFKNRTCFCMIW